MSFAEPLVNDLVQKRVEFYAMADYGNGMELYMLQGKIPENWKSSPPRKVYVFMKDAEESNVFSYVVKPDLSVTVMFFGDAQEKMFGGYLEGLGYREVKLQKMGEREF